MSYRIKIVKNKFIIMIKKLLFIISALILSLASVLIGIEKARVTMSIIVALVMTVSQRTG